MRFLDESGAPTDRYRRFRDGSQSGAVLAEGLADAYRDVFSINERAHTLSASELKGIFARLTGKQEGVVEKMATTFRAFAARADFGVCGLRCVTPAPSRLSATEVGAPAETHPLIMGLLRELPTPGSTFSEKKQRDWLNIAQAAFRLIYVTSDDDGGGESHGGPSDEVSVAEVAERTE
jgi:hypothetical protein